MARIIGDYTGTTWDDFLVLPNVPENDEKFTPDDVDLSTDLAGVKLKMPFQTAAMRSVTGKDMALAAGKLGMMAVAPRGLTIEKEAEIVKYVKDNAVKVGEIESECNPTKVQDTDTLGVAISKARKTGHSNIPVVARKSDFVGMFQYKPSKHDSMNTGTPITKLMQPYSKDSNRSIEVCNIGMSDEDIRDYLKKKHSKDKKTRLVPVIDNEGRLEKLVFLQTFDAYKVGAAIDTHEGWEERAEALIDAGADMIFIDTSDAHKPFSREVIEKHANTVRRYKEMGKHYPPICGGNIVIPEAFDYLVKAGADAIKLGMGPGSICTTNEVFGVGAPPFWSVVEVAKRRDELFSKKGIYIPVIADGGIEGTNHMAAALAFADAVMGGKVFGCFFESAGERFDGHGNPLPRHDSMDESNIVYIRIYGEGSPEAMAITGDMKRYATPLSKRDQVATFQGVSGLTKYRGRTKPGIENYYRTLQEVAYHVGARDLKTYRDKAVLIRLSEGAKVTARPHGIDIIGD